MRPGDPIIYFDDASHVGMYVGDGSVVHAPRPARAITVAGAGSMPILGVVRPDPATAADEPPAAADKTPAADRAPAADQDLSGGPGPVRRSRGPAPEE